MRLPTVLDLTTDRGVAECAGWSVVLAGLAIVCLGKSWAVFRGFPNIDLTHLTNNDRDEYTP